MQNAYLNTSNLQLEDVKLIVLQICLNAVNTQNLLKYYFKNVLFEAFKERK